MLVTQYKRSEPTTILWPRTNGPRIRGDGDLTAGQSGSRDMYQQLLVQLREDDLQRRADALRTLIREDKSMFAAMLNLRRVPAQEQGDILAELYTRMFEHIHNIEDLRAWLRVTLTRLVVDNWRARDRFRSLPAPQGEGAPPPQEAIAAPSRENWVDPALDDFEFITVLAEYAAQFIQFVFSERGQDRHIQHRYLTVTLLLLTTSGISAEQLARAMDSNAGAVRQRIGEMRKKLKDYRTAAPTPAQQLLHATPLPPDCALTAMTAMAQRVLREPLALRAFAQLAQTSSKGTTLFLMVTYLEWPVEVLAHQLGSDVSILESTLRETGEQLENRLIALDREADQ